MSGSVCQLSAVQLAAAIRGGVLSAREATEAALARIDELEDRVHAFITVDAAGALEVADRCDRVAREGSVLPPLHGVPVAVKDVTATKGLRTTSGSTIYAEHVPARDELSVSRLRNAGAVIVGKANTPEFAFGAVCTNRLRGPTANPWNLALTSGGSSGGSAVAVTTGMVPLAQGTDFGGSVRTPAFFCGCVGLRPTPGTIPEPRRPLGFDTLATQGVLARTVADASLMIGAMAGPHHLDPTSQRPVWPGEDTTSLRVAASATLGGEFRIDPEVRHAFEESMQRAEGVIGPIHSAHPDCAGASEAFQTLRAAASWLKFGDLVERHEHALTSSFVWNVRRGRTIGAEDFLRAETVRTRVWRAFREFFESFDVLILPAASVLPFPNDQGEVTQVDGEECETIIDYLACTYIVSLVGFPALALPAIWTDDGEPFGIQLVARPHAEATLIKVGMMLEAAGFTHHWPPLVEAR